MKKKYLQDLQDPESSSIMEGLRDLGEGANEKSQVEKLPAEGTNAVELLQDSKEEKKKEKSSRLREKKKRTVNDENVKVQEKSKITKKRKSQKINEVPSIPPKRVRIAKTSADFIYYTR